MRDSLWLFVALLSVDYAVFAAYSQMLKCGKSTLAASIGMTALAVLSLPVAVVSIARLVWSVNDAGGQVTGMVVIAAMLACAAGLVASALLVTEVQRRRPDEDTQLI